DGSPAADAPKWTDVARVHVAGSRTPAKLRTKMKSKHPPGAADAFYGSTARPRARDRIVFVAVEMARKLPANAMGQLVEVGLAGTEATPVQVGTDLDTHAGVERFSLSGLFKNGAIATGDTDVIGKEPGAELEDADYYDLESGVYGFYQPKRATWYLAIPRTGEVDDIVVSVRSTTDAGQVIDRLELPGGGHFIDLRDPTGGFKKNAGVSALTCRAIETFSGGGGVVELSDIDATLIRYTAGVDPTVGQRKRAELLGQAVEAAGPVSVLLSRAGSDDEPEMVEGQLAVAPEGNAVQLAFEAPAGQWTFELADALVTPSGERVVDHATLTGPAGVLTGPGLDGLAAGDLSCLGADDPDEAEDAGGAPAAGGAEEAEASEEEAGA
ncbi:MAG: hypothetical protein AB1Z66_05255, partial [Candidatus Limnocylindrales bacterium]